MLNRTYDNQVCSIARTLEVIGERWTILVLRDAFMGIRRFDDFQRDLGIARNVLADRLQRLVDAEILDRRPYQERPPRYEYRLTDRGRELFPVLHSLRIWGDRYLAPDGPPRLIRHRDCGGEIDEHLTCTKCGARVTAREVTASDGPGMKAAAA
jgi:DNA-binding HxlR family transcriptional regulator